MGNKCHICGYDKCHSSLEFHHINPHEKDKQLARNLEEFSIELIVLELEKCILLCRNCHREVHVGFTLLTNDITNKRQNANELLIKYNKVLENDLFRIEV
jgi:hypothetical protein